MLETDESLRSSGVEIVEKGPKPGFIKINYAIWGLWKSELRDTIVRPSYTRISEKAW